VSAGGNLLNLGIVLAVISIMIVVCPILSAVFMYRGDITELVTPNIDELRDKIEDFFPTVEYVGCEVIGPEFSMKVMFNVTNNSDRDFKFTSMNFSVYCSQHGKVLLGYGYGAGLPLTISGRSSRILSLHVIFTTEGLIHIGTQHRGDRDFHAILKDMVVVAQGVEVKLGEEIDVGPIEIPP